MGTIRPWPITTSTPLLTQAAFSPFKLRYLNEQGIIVGLLTSGGLSLLLIVAHSSSLDAIACAFDNTFEGKLMIDDH